MSGAQDLYGNAISTLSWSFTTAPAPDTTPPSVTTRTPSSGATGVALGSPVTASFSEQIQATTASFVLKNGSNTVTAVVTYNPANETLTLAPSSTLSASTTYTATLSGAQDLSGNTMSSVSWSFTTTAATVTTAPTVTSRNPAASATGVEIASSIAATFSTEVQPSTISFTLKNGSASVPASVVYDPASDTVTLTPSASLAYATTYTATLSGAKDLYSNTMSTLTWTFTTTSAPVTSAPTVTAETPASGASNVAVTSPVSATLSALVQPGTISFSLTAGTTTVAASVAYNPANETVTLTPTTSLSPSTTYTATLSGARDLHGNTMSPVTWSFTTTAAPDTTAPTVTAKSPAASATLVPIGSDVSATFSEPVQASTITFTLKNGVNTVGSTVNYDPATKSVELVPTSNLAASTTYTASLSGAQDLSGNVMTTLTWTFTTAASPGTTPPAVTAETPAPNALLVATNSTVTATFNEAVTSSTVNASNFVLKNSSGTTVAATVSYNTTSHVATLTPTTALAASSTYTATISGVTDSGGHTMASAFSWSFTTTGPADTTAPTVTSRSPASSATGVAIASTVTATFSEQVQLSTATFTLKNGATTISSTVSYNPASQTLTLKPARAWRTGRPTPSA